MMDSDSSDETDLLHDKIELHPNNPYVTPYVTNPTENIFAEEVYNGSTIFLPDNKTVQIPQPYIQLAVEVHKMSAYIRCLCILEGCYNVFYSYKIYGIFYSSYGIVCCSCGYFATFSYKKRQMLYFLIYEYSQVLIKSVLMMYLYMLYFTKQLENENVNPILILTFQTIVAVIQFMIAGTVREYYNLLPYSRQIRDSIVL